MTFHHLRAPRPAVAPPAASQLGPVTQALRAVRKAMTKPTKVGPVTEAIRTMRAAVPDFDANRDVLCLRRALASRIEADIALLDALDGDPDLEPSLSFPEANLASIQAHYCRSAVTRRLPGEGLDAGGTVDVEYDPAEGPIDDNELDLDIVDERHDDEPRECDLGSLGGTAKGCEGSQLGWSDGDRKDREACPDVPFHSEHYAPAQGPAVDEARQWGQRQADRKERKRLGLPDRSNVANLRLVVTGPCGDAFTVSRR